MRHKKPYKTITKYKGSYAPEYIAPDRTEEYAAIEAKKIASQLAEEEFSQAMRSRAPGRTTSRLKSMRLLSGAMGITLMKSLIKDIENE